MVGVAINNQLRVDCLRDISQYGANNDPVVNVLSEDFTCNPFGKQRAKSSCTVKPGDVLTFYWRISPSGYSPMILSEHNGPATVMLGIDNGQQFPNQWFKVMEMGALNNNGESYWATHLIADTGKHVFTVPNVPKGNYVLRAEIGAFHKAQEAQFYIRCMHITVENSGGSLPRQGDMRESPGQFIGMNTYGYNLDPKNSLIHTSYAYPGPRPWKGIYKTWTGNTRSLKDFDKVQDGQEIQDSNAWGYGDGENYTPQERHSDSDGTQRRQCKTRY